jgi:hypothetical protein
MIPIDDTINLYLDRLGATLWGRAFNINDKEDRDEAVAFIRDLWRDLENYEVFILDNAEIDYLVEISGVEDET